MTNEIDKIISKIKKKIETFLTDLAKLNKAAPSLNQLYEQIKLIEISESDAPNISKQYVDERFMFNLETTNNLLTELPSIAIPHPYTEPIVTTSGTTVSITYVNNLNKIKNLFPEDDQIIKWVDSSKIMFLDYRQQQDRSNQVTFRLSQIDPRLAELHSSAIDASHLASSEVQKSVEAAVTLRELLDQYKGILISKCRTGKGTKFSRIANNIIIDSDTTQEAVINGQEIYDILHSELSLIAKSRKEVTGDQMLDYLQQTEDFIWMVTNAIDPSKVDFNFS